MLHYYQKLLDSLKQAELTEWAEQLPAQIQAGLDEQRYGDLPQWKQSLDALPFIDANQVNLKDGVSIATDTALDDDTLAALKASLKGLIPWRKGPFSLFGIDIDTEWRSDWKWERLLPHIAPLKGRTVLDVGCGNGYHCLRMLGEDAKRVIGIDPSPRFIIQFLMLKHFLHSIPVDVLPIGIESLPMDLACFDTSFSMGVLYHRRSPMDHLRELKATLKPGGQLVLETLIIEGQLGDCLVPEGRYAMMRNVWFLPSAPTLISWLKKCGFKNPRLVDSNWTSSDEQRSSDWMHFQSLPDFLNPNDKTLTVEGHPAPLRGIFIAET
ncbi:MAG: tRNA 5-methoxyuridine(34)/uridine 5-oxyacetic acid(34) synthase CmoB [Cellvibrionaceae bacterium]